MSTPASSEIFAERRRRMVDNQLRPQGVNDLAILAAFAETPREKFIEPASASLAYLDREAPALDGGGRLLLAPAAIGRLIQAAKPRPGERALDVAGGSGYAASVLARLGVRVVALETVEGGQGAKTALAGEDGIEIVVGDLAAGVAAKAPFDLILVHGAFEIWPERLIAQLAEGGRLVGFDATLAAPKAVLIEKAGGATSRRLIGDLAAPRLDAFKRPPQFAF